MISKFLTKRFILSATGIGLATWLAYTGKISGENWVYAFAIALAGHHAEDIAKVLRGDRGVPP